MPFVRLLFRRRIIGITAFVTVLLASLSPSVFALAATPDEGTVGIEAPRPRMLPTDPFANKVCVGPNADGTVSQGQTATCTIFAHPGVFPYIASDVIEISRLSPDPTFGVIGCTGINTVFYSTTASLATTNNACSYHVVTGFLGNDTVIGTEVISIPNSFASGAPIQQGVEFCYRRPLGGYTCSHNDTAVPIEVTGPAAIVIDEIPPTFTSQPADLTLDATSPAGAVGTYVVPTATDNAPEPVTVACNRAPGSTFPIGQTIVTCIAVDHSGNSRTESFTVTVIHTFESLRRVTQREVDDSQIAHSLSVKLEGAEEAASRGNSEAANGMLGAFVNELDAQAGKAIDAGLAAGLQGLAGLLMT